MPTRFYRIGLVSAGLSLLQKLSLPIMSFFALYAVGFAYGVRLTGETRTGYFLLALVATLLSYIFFSARPDAEYSTNMIKRAAAEKITIAWICVIAVLLFLGYAGQISAEFSRRVLLTWFIVTPIATTILWILLRGWLRESLARSGAARTAVIAGVNSLSEKLAESLKSHPEFGLAFKGYFDDRDIARIGGDNVADSVLGKLQDLADYARANEVDTIFFAIPIGYLNRTNQLLDQLSDSTVSIYFIPDIFVMDLIQARADDLNGIPVLALCESPFHGLRGSIKRLSDVVLALICLVIAAPLMLLIAAAIKLTTKESVIFRQRRYGLGGREIQVYKFRTMTSSDDGSEVTQASRHDPRVTPIGRILRRFSLDELPQLINVLQGRMSVVGPRPHAVAHNEEYRTQIKGYMMRHKVAPGITGLAQVNGCRGELLSADDMERRISFDLRYLREWSLLLDLKILALTFKSIFADEKAY